MTLLRAQSGTSSINVLFLNGGRRVELIRMFRRAMENLALSGRIVATDIQDSAPALIEADVKELLPHSRDTGFVAALIDLCRRHEIGLIVPTIDPDLLTLARRRAEIEATGPRLLLGPIEAIFLCRDKSLLMAALDGGGVPVPRTFMLEEARTEPLPLFIKPRDGSGSNHAVKVETREQLEFFAGSYVPNPMIQEFFDGEEFTVDLWLDDASRPLAAVPRLRLKVRAGEVVTARVQRDQELEEIASRAASVLKLVGPCNVQIVRSTNKGPAVIEVNPRFGGGVILSAVAGAPMAEWSLLWALGRSPTSLSPDVRNGLTMLRYDDSFFVE